ncbi:MAG: zinc-binding dehydrogenase [Firmicutes bacterium]|nr:zinc-binding dehydrogenase [Bacillota bacterium]
MVIECVGRPETQEEAVSVVQRGGTVVLFGCGPMGSVFSVDSFGIYANEITIRGAALNPFTHARAIRLISEGRVETGSLVTSQVGLAALPNLLSTGFGDHDLKVVVQPAR